MDIGLGEGVPGGERGVCGKIPHPHHRSGSPPAHQKVGHLILVIP